MTRAERRSIRNAFKVVERTVEKGFRNIERSVARLDVAERESTAEFRSEIKAVRKEQREQRTILEETRRHVRFTSASIESLTRALVKAKVIEQDAAVGGGTGYSEILSTPRGPRRR